PAVSHSRLRSAKKLNITRLCRACCPFQTTSPQEATVRSRTLTCITVLTLFVTLAIPVRLSAQQIRYKLIDIGTLGGPSAHGPGNGAGSQLLNNAGQVAGTADTSEPDPNAPNCANSDCFVSHAFRWQHGVITDLGVLAGVNWSDTPASHIRRAFVF